MFTEDVSSDQKFEGQKDQIIAEEKESSLVWTLEFDESCSSSKSGMGVVLISLERELEPMTFKLEFGNTNNMVEYDALLLRIIDAKEKGIKILKA